MKDKKIALTLIKLRGMQGMSTEMQSNTSRRKTALTQKTIMTPTGQLYIDPFDTNKNNTSLLSLTGVLFVNLRIVTATRFCGNKIVT